MEYVSNRYRLNLSIMGIMLIAVGALAGACAGNKSGGRPKLPSDAPPSDEDATADAANDAEADGAAADAGDAAVDTDESGSEAACASLSLHGDAADLTYNDNAKAIIDANCVSCHSAGGHAFPDLSNYDSVKANAQSIFDQVKPKAMPPGEPLSDHDYEELLAWLESDDLPEGGETEVEDCEEEQAEVSTPPTPVEPELERVDHVVEFPVHEIKADENGDENYWVSVPLDLEDRTYYITGAEVEGRDTKGKIHPALHHLLVIDSENIPDAMEGSLVGGDASGTKGTIQDLLKSLQGGGMATGETDALNKGSSLFKFLNLMGGMVMGTTIFSAPENHGIEINGKTNVVLSVHVNSKMAPPDADKSIKITVKLRLEDKVERRAYNVLLVNPAWALGKMEIPANDPSVTHSYEFDPWLWTPTASKKLNLFASLYHMHSLGVSGKLDYLPKNGTTTNLQDITDYNYAMQKIYPLDQPLTMTYGDKLKVGCTWDNSPENQPYVQGVQRTSAAVNWGEGTLDEMCMLVMQVGEE